MWVYVEGGLEKGRAAEVTPEEAVTLGSGAGCTIALADPDVAPLHASFRVADEGLELVPLTQDEPTTVDGERITEATRVTPGQQIVVGDVPVSLRDRAPADDEAD